MIHKLQRVLVIVSVTAGLMAWTSVAQGGVIRTVAGAARTVAQHTVRAVKRLPEASPPGAARSIKHVSVKVAKASASGVRTASSAVAKVVY